MTTPLFTPAGRTGALNTAALRKSFPPKWISAVRTFSLRAQASLLRNCN